MPRPRRRKPEAPKLEWCEFEPGDFPESQFHDSAKYGRLHVHRGTRLHTKAGEPVNGPVFPEAVRAELVEKFDAALIEDVLSPQ
jgi:hypothetical protein